MKTKSILFGLLVLALAGLFIITNKAPAQNNPHQTSAEVLMFQSTFNINPEYPVGIYPYLISSSKGAPKVILFPNPDATSSAQVIADCLNQGYEIQFVNQVSVLLVKPVGR